MFLPGMRAKCNKVVTSYVNVVFVCKFLSKFRNNLLSISYNSSLKLGKYWNRTYPYVGELSLISEMIKYLKK